MSKELLSRYINGSCSRREAGTVLLYIQTEEGRRELESQMALLEDSPALNEPLPRSATERMLSRIRERSAPRTTALFPARLWRAAASVIIVLGFGCLGYNYRRELSAAIFPVRYNEITMPEGYTGNVTLADGTVVTLNSRARIRYPEDMLDQATRTVYLQGEAYFKVMRNPEKPFIITTQNTEIRVLGTAFNVRESASDSSTTVAVTEGTVSFKKTTDMTAGLTLRAGDVGTLQADTLSQFHFNNTSNYTSWQSGTLSFDRVKLCDVARQLEYLYGMNISLKGENLNNMRLTADMRRGSAEYVIREIAAYLQLDYTIHDNTAQFHKPKH